MNTSEIKPLLERVLRNLEADLAFAKKTLKHPNMTKLYVVTLDKNYDAIMRVDSEGRGNFTGTLSNCHLLSLKEALAAVESVKADPKNAEHLEKATVDYERLVDVCKRAIEKLPEQIAYTQEALAKA